MVLSFLPIHSKVKDASTGNWYESYLEFVDLWTDWNETDIYSEFAIGASSPDIFFLTSFNSSFLHSDCKQVKLVALSFRHGALIVNQAENEYIFSAVSKNKEILTTIEEK